jgi:predicted transcriptional regulator
MYVISAQKRGCKRPTARAVADFVALNAWQLDKIEAGMEAADRGEFASDEEVARVRAKFAPKT